MGKFKEITVTTLNEDGTDGVGFTFYPNKAQASFEKKDDGFIWLHAPNLRHGSVRIKESIKDLLKQVKSINVIS